MNSTGEELHPNWRALSTLHVPLKRFVRAGAAEQQQGKLAKQRQPIVGVSGVEVQQFYQELLQTPATARQAQRGSSPKQSYREKQQQPPQLPFNQYRFYCLAIDNNVQELDRMCISQEQLNCRDLNGWTALMMAACEGAAQAVDWLLRRGASAELADRAGNTALRLARQKGHADAVQLLESGQREEEQEQELQQAPEEQHAEHTAAPFHCRVCQRDYAASTWRAHQCSTVHQFNLQSSLPAHKLQRFNIPARNRGLQLMLKQGWDREHGLGPHQSGRLYPVKTVLRRQRTGLGIEQSPARVTHLLVANARVGGNPSTQQRQPRRTRDDMRREKLQDWRRERRLRSELS
ncbi:hypothetical protein KR222_005246 [Zaprionus bogoriensis]|nr:hypothetical protein KR222_005246 [Zaprionus bogoriensis]